MHDGPSRTEADIPSPKLVAAWLVLDTIPTERIPLWAAHWLAAGYDGHALAELAGLHGDDPRAVRDLLLAALIDCGVQDADLELGDQSRRRAQAMSAFTAAAKLCIDGRASERWVVSKVVEIVEPDFDELITELPLGSLVRLDDEWRAGRGRSDEQLRAEVRRACSDQLRAAQTLG